jgi:hypothetical protein
MLNMFKENKQVFIHRSIFTYINLYTYIYMTVSACVYIHMGMLDFFKENKQVFFCTHLTEKLMSIMELM